MHGFPDSAWTYRHLLPELAKAGYRAVACFMRGYAPTEVPADARYDMRTIGDDFNALHAALGGKSDAVLVAHDWAAVAAYSALHTGAANWRRATIINVPPMPAFAQVGFTYAQLKRFFYIWFFQMDCAEAVVSANDMAFIDGLWGDWSPGYDASYDLKRVKEALGKPENLRAALGYYHRQMNPRRFGLPDEAAAQAQVWGNPLTMPVLYLHGTRDGCVAIDAEVAKCIPGCFGPGSEMHFVQDVGHFMLVEKPAVVNPRIVEFLGRR
jgi:pimeloyl-ACP methyl ester carboxylesterase